MGAKQPYFLVHSLAAPSVCEVREYGATGNGRTKDTQAIRIHLFRMLLHAHFLGRLSGHIHRLLGVTEFVSVQHHVPG